MFRPAISLMLLVSILILSCGQNTKTELEDTAYWNARFLDSSYSLLYKNEDTAKALQYYDSSLKQADDITVYPKAARFGMIANYYYFFTPDNEATLRMIDSALALYNTSNLQDRYPRTYVGYLLFGGEIAYRLSQYNKANKYYFKAKMLADSHLDPCERKAYNYSIAMVLYQQQNFRASLNYFEEAYALQSTCSPLTTAIVLQQQEIQDNIGLCHIQLKNYDSAMVHFEKALQIADQYKDSLGAASMDRIYGVVYGNMAKVFIAKNQVKKAEQLSKKSIALNYREGYEVEDAIKVMLQLVEVYSRKKDFFAMFEILNSLKDRIRHADPATHLEWRRLMASYYEQTSQPGLSLQFFKNYTSLKDSIAIEQKKLTAADLTRQLTDIEKELQITTLKKDKQLALVSLLVTVVISCMALVIIYLVYQTYRRSKKNLAVSLALNQEIKRQKAAREEEAEQRHKLITEAVIQAQESERSLIGLELHDNINQVLTTVKLHNEMVLEGVGDPKILLPRASQYLQECISEIRDLSKRLSAPTLGKISLEESVKDLIESINLTSKVKITSQLSGLNSQLLKKDVHIGVYRILQEQLNNVLKHAEASEVFVHLEHDGSKLRLSIKDNGRGFVVHRHKSGIGLMNMQTRAENLNGTFEVESKPGHGCKVEVVVPCAS
ncbi:sensor histidine kinase [Chitinophagaceae bacterium LB-8]|uniref:Sensor histidine kinase n=1 Tax=Paraflavisolibacter caeni TaxID=2982496 RepID=A0A9X2Y1Q5_9BACT|nr:sensor histidine kinase [Paraflavisolibacter caeni]MCU7551763.1 sensor histidine kinase [Paraflavisolibacter caeni]